MTTAGDGRRDDDQFGVETLSSQESVFEPLRVSYALYSERDGELTEEHLEACAKLARSIEVCRLGRPQSLERLDGLVRRLGAEIRP